MQRHLQLELKRDLRCRLPVPSVYVSRFHISGHWDPDALARWYTLIPTCRLVYRAAPPCAEVTAEYTGLALENAVVKLGVV